MASPAKHGTRMLAILLAAAFLLPLAAVPSAAAEGTVVLRSALLSYPSTNPLSPDPDSQGLLGMIYDSAVKRHPDTGELIPYIAVGSANLSQDLQAISWKDCAVGNFGYCPGELWEDPSRPEVIIFYDFENVKWHDGTPMTLRDIMFSLHAHSRSPTPWLGNPLADMAGGLSSNYSESHWLHAEPVWQSEDGSRAALRFVLQDFKYSVFENILSGIIMPYHIWGYRSANQMADDAKIWCDPEYNISNEYSWKYFRAAQWPNPVPIGSGPFRWASATETEITLVPWQEYFYRPGFKYIIPGAGIAPSPNLDSVTLTVYRTEEQALLDLEAGRVDHIGWSISQDALSRFSDNLDVQYRFLRSCSMTYLGFNMGRTSFGYVTDFRDGPAPYGTDYGKPLRKAIAHCIDLDALGSMANPLLRDAAPLEALSSWRNESAPTYTFDPFEANRILDSAGYLLNVTGLPPGGGNWRSNPDGSPIGRGIGGTVEVLVTEMGYGLLRYQAANTLVSQMRAVGINAALVPLDPYPLLMRLESGEFDMFIGLQDLSGMYRERPEIYYYGSFNSAMSPPAPNYFRYSNSSFNAGVNAAMSASALEDERQHVRDAIASIAYDLPIYPLYHEPNTEAYRVAAFDGFVDDGTGTLLNPRSVASVFRQDRLGLRARFTGIAMTCPSNSTMTVSVSVTDQANRAVAGAEISLTASSGTLLRASGRTDANGIFSTNFTAPFVPLMETYNNWEAVRITVESATKAGYRPAPLSEYVVTVLPVSMRSMIVTAHINPDVLANTNYADSPPFADLELRVTDLNGIPLDGALLTIVSGGEIEISEAEARTDQGGTATVRLYAPNVEHAREFTVTVNATRGGFIDANTSFAITVLPAPAEPPEPEDPWLRDAAVPAAVAVTLACLAAAVIIGRRRNR